MQKYWFLLKYEFKNLLRDKMNLTMFIYPLIMLVMAVFFFPFLFKMDDMNASGLQVTMVMLIVALVGFGFMIAAILLGFSLLDNKDEDTMQTIAVTPISKKGYVSFKLIYTYVLSVINTVIMLGGTKLFASNQYVITYGLDTVYIFNAVSYWHILFFSLSMGLLVPALGLLIVAVSKNKVEGFAYMKSTGFLILIPAITMLPSFRGMGQYLLSIFPNFWGTQAMLNLMFPQLFLNGANLNFSLYLLIGAVVSLIYSYLSYKLYMRKAV